MVWYKGAGGIAMSTEQEPQALEKREEDRIRQIEEGLYSLPRQILNIEDRLSFIIQRLEVAELYTPEMVSTDSVVPSRWRYMNPSITPSQLVDTKGFQSFR
jgi:hypothetical protein